MKRPGPVLRFYKRALTAAELATLHNWLSFGAPARNVYSATVSENCQFSDLVWTPEMPSKGFGPDDILDVTCASSDCTVSMLADNMPTVAGMVMRGGTLKHAVAHITSAPKWIKLENGAVNSASGILTIGKELSGLLTVGGTTNTVFASGATLDLSANVQPFVQPATMTFAGAVNIVLPDGVCRKTKLISWEAPPADGVTFAVVDGLPQGMKLDLRSDGLYLVRPGMVIIVK